MEEKSQMELVYEEYINRDDTRITIDDLEYWRIMDKYHFREGEVIIVMPNDFFRDTKMGIILVDEEGKEIVTDSMAFFRFSRKIPEWYFNTVSVSVKGISDESEIGEYLAVKH